MEKVSLQHYHHSSINIPQEELTVEFEDITSVIYLYVNLPTGSKISTMVLYNST